MIPQKTSFIKRVKEVSTMKLLQFAAKLVFFT